MVSDKNHPIDFLLWLQRWVYWINQECKDGKSCYPCRMGLFYFSIVRWPRWVKVRCRQFYLYIRSNLKAEPMISSIVIWDFHVRLCLCVDDTLVCFGLNPSNNFFPLESNSKKLIKSQIQQCRLADTSEAKSELTEKILKQLSNSNFLTKVSK